MSAMTKEEFAKRVMLVAKRSETFEPTAYYDPDGDCIEFLASPENFYAERVDDLVTVYYSEESNEVIGSLIKGVSKYFNEIRKAMPGFAIEIHAGRVKLVHLFRAKLWTLNAEPSDVPTLIYRKLIDVAEESNVEAENIGMLFSPRQSTPPHKLER